MESWLDENCYEKDGTIWRRGTFYVAVGDFSGPVVVSAEVPSTGYVGFEYEQYAEVELDIPVRRGVDGSAIGRWVYDESVLGNRFRREELAEQQRSANEGRYLNSLSRLVENSPNVQPVERNQSSIQMELLMTFCNKFGVRLEDLSKKTFGVSRFELLLQSVSDSLYEVVLRAAYENYLSS